MTAAVAGEFDRGGPQSEVKERFYKYFQETCIGTVNFPYCYFILMNLEIQEHISQLESHAIIGGERKDAVDHLNVRISRLSDDVTDLTGFVPPYDQRIYSQVSVIRTRRRIHSDPHRLLRD
jgi:hypothetical protein